MPLLGFLGWPVTASSNSVAAFNFLLRLGLALSALSMYLVLRRYVRSRSAAFVGGLLFGFSPYMLAEGRLHVFLVFLPLLPPLIPLVDRWLIRADRNPYRCGALFGLLLGLEMLISVELAAVFAILVVIALIPVAIRHHDLVRSRVPVLVRGLMTAGAAWLLVGGYPAWMFLRGPQRPAGPPHSVAGIDDLPRGLAVPGHPVASAAAPAVAPAGHRRPVRAGQHPRERVLPRRPPARRPHRRVRLAAPSTFSCSASRQSG